MAGLLDFLFQGQQGGGLLGGYGQQPMQINPGVQQQGLNVANQQPQNMAGSLDPSFFANQVRQNQQQPPGLLFSADSGLLGGLRGALNQIGDPQGQRQQQAIQNYLAVKSAEEKPQYIQSEDPNTGIKRIVQIQPFGRGASYVNPNEPGQAAGGAPPQSPLTLPPGADVHTARIETAKGAVANQQDAVASAKAAAQAAPLLEEARAAYKNVIDLGAGGPIAANPYIGRPMALGMSVLGDATGLGSTSKPLEEARQRYDKAISALQILVNAFKGQGQVSNYERSLAKAQYPDLTALNPHDQLSLLENQVAENRRTIEAGKIPSLGQAPQVGAVLNRSEINPGNAPAPPQLQTTPPQQVQQAPPMAPQAQPGSPGPAIAPAAAPIKVQTQAQYNMIPPGQTYIAPDGSIRTKGGAAPRPQPSAGAIY